MARKICPDRRRIDVVRSLCVARRREGHPTAETVCGAAGDVELEFEIDVVRLPETLVLDRGEAYAACPAVAGTVHVPDGGFSVEVIHIANLDVRLFRHDLGDFIGGIRIFVYRSDVSEIYFGGRLGTAAEHEEDKGYPLRVGVAVFHGQIYLIPRLCLERIERTSVHVVNVHRIGEQFAHRDGRCGRGSVRAVEINRTARRSLRVVADAGSVVADVHFKRHELVVRIVEIGSGRAAGAVRDRRDDVGKLDARTELLRSILSAGILIEDGARHLPFHDQFDRFSRVAHRRALRKVGFRKRFGDMRIVCIIAQIVHIELLARVARRHQEGRAPHARPVIRIVCLGIPHAHGDPFPDDERIQPHPFLVYKIQPRNIAYIRHAGRDPDAGETVVDGKVYIYLVFQINIEREVIAEFAQMLDPVRGAVAQAGTIGKRAPPGVDAVGKLHHVPALTGGVGSFRIIALVGVAEQNKFIGGRGDVAVLFRIGDLVRPFGDESIIQPIAHVTHVYGGVILLHEVERRVRRGRIEQERVQIVHDGKPPIADGHIRLLSVLVEDEQPIGSKAVAHGEIRLIFQPEIQIGHTLAGRIIHIVREITYPLFIHRPQRVVAAGNEYAALIHQRRFFVMLINIHSFRPAADRFPAGIRAVIDVQAGTVYKRLLYVIFMDGDADRRRNVFRSGIGDPDRRFPRAFCRDDAVRDGHKIGSLFHGIVQFRRSVLFTAVQQRRADPRAVQRGIRGVVNFDLRIFDRDLIRGAAGEHEGVFQLQPLIFRRDRHFGSAEL